MKRFLFILSVFMYLANVSVKASIQELEPEIYEELKEITESLSSNEQQELLKEIGKTQPRELRNTLVDILLQCDRNFELPDRKGYTLALYNYFKEQNLDVSYREEYKGAANALVSIVSSLEEKTEDKLNAVDLINIFKAFIISSHFNATYNVDDLLSFYSHVYNSLRRSGLKVQAIEDQIGLSRISEVVDRFRLTDLNRIIPVCKQVKDLMRHPFVRRNPELKRQNAEEKFNLWSNLGTILTTVPLEKAELITNFLTWFPERYNVNILRLVNILAAENVVFHNAVFNEEITDLLKFSRKLHSNEEEDLLEDITTIVDRLGHNNSLNAKELIDKIKFYLIKNEEIADYFCEKLDPGYRFLSSTSRNQIEGWSTFLIKLDSYEKLETAISLSSKATQFYRDDEEGLIEKIGHILFKLLHGCSQSEISMDLKKDRPEISILRLASGNSRIEIDFEKEITGGKLVRRTDITSFLEEEIISERGKTEIYFRNLVRRADMGCAERIFEIFNRYIGNGLTINFPEEMNINPALYEEACKLKLRYEEDVENYRIKQQRYDEAGIKRQIREDEFIEDHGPTYSLMDSGYFSSDEE